PTTFSLFNLCVPGAPRRRVSSAVCSVPSAWSAVCGHRSHASPTPSPSLSSWSGLASSGQLSHASSTPSPSTSLVTDGHAVKRKTNAAVPVALAGTLARYWNRRVARPRDASSAKDVRLYAPGSKVSKEAPPSVDRSTRTTSESALKLVSKTAGVWYASPCGHAPPQVEVVRPPPRLSRAISARPASARRRYAPVAGSNPSAARPALDGKVPTRASA